MKLTPQRTLESNLKSVHPSSEYAGKLGVVVEGKEYLWHFWLAECISKLGFSGQRKFSKK